MNRLRLIQVAWAGTILALCTWAVFARGDRAGFEISGTISVLHLLAALGTLRDVRVGWAICCLLSLLALCFFGLVTVLTATMYLAGKITFSDNWTIGFVLALFLILMVLPSALSIWMFWKHRHPLLEIFGFSHRDGSRPGLAGARPQEEPPQHHDHC